VLGDEEFGPADAPWPRGRRLGPVKTEADDAPDWVVAYGPLLEAIDEAPTGRIELAYDLEIEVGQEQNVIGILRPDPEHPRPELASQAVVLSAHYDHLGSLPDVPDAPEHPGGEAVDRIFNGADDDASGVACVLELAGALAAQPRGGRPLVFLLAAAEEVGLWGTEHYLDAPPIPLDATCSNLNFEMIGRPDPLMEASGRMWLTGFEHSNVGPELRALGLDIAPDARPEQHFYERSDNYAFVRRGVVGQSFSSYGMHTDYHRPSDEADTLDYPHLEACTRTALQAVRYIVDGRIDPRWVREQPGESGR
jgi:hypothetical protein